MAQIPDTGDNTSLFVSIAGAIGTILTAIGGAYVAVRKSKSDTTQTAMTTAQITVSSSLEAMKTVVSSLTAELERKQSEIDELREEIREVRTNNRRLEELNTQQGLQIDRLTDVAKTLKERVEGLEKLNPRTGDYHAN